MGGVKEGGRDNAMIRLAGWLREFDFSRELADDIMRLAAKNCDPEFDEDVALAKVERAYEQWEPGEHSKESAADDAAPRSETKRTNW